VFLFPAPIKTLHITQDIINRSMDVPIVTLTLEELYSLSPELQTKLRNHISIRQAQPSPQQIFSIAQPSISTTTRCISPCSTPRIRALRSPQSPFAIVISANYSSIIINSCSPNPMPHHFILSFIIPIPSSFIFQLRHSIIASPLTIRFLVIIFVVLPL
jgi:hypothetical protein